MRMLILFVMVLTSGCAAIISGGTQSVTIATPDVEEACCTLTDSKGRTWDLDKTPGTVLVKKGDGPISVICRKEGYSPGIGEINTNITPSNYGNLALGPLAPIGYFLDSLTGSAERYESKVEVEMEKVKRGRWEL